MNILIISSNYTGCGHKSICTALNEQFSKHKGTNVYNIEGFDLNGKVCGKLGKSYGFMTRKAKFLWKAVWNMSINNPAYIDTITKLTMKKNFLKLLEDVKPDLILSIHPNYNRSVMNILQENNIKIPFITLIADLVSISPLWVDSRANYIICPTEEAKQKCLQYGASEAALKVMGFPVRSKFYKLNSPISYNEDKLKRPMRFLIMSGGEGVGNLGEIAVTLLDSYNCEISIITARNTTLKRNLEKTLLPKYGNKVKLYGFIDNIHDIMAECDILITRGSPNVMMEAVASNIPIIVTGVLLGQEMENSSFIEKNNLGVTCRDLSELTTVVNNMLSDNKKCFNLISDTQRKFGNPNTAKDIVDFILSLKM